MLHLISATAVQPPEWVSLLTQGGAIGVLAFVVAGFVKGWIVPGSAYKEVCVQRDRAIDQVYRLADAAQRAVEVADRKAVEVADRNAGR